MIDSVLTKLNRVTFAHRKRHKKERKAESVKTAAKGTIKMKEIVSFRYQIRSRTFPYSL